jgi:glycosyltransferase involved in cell wall biosynthesis
MRSNRSALEPPKKLVIAHVDAETSFSGGEVQVFLLLEGLRARGHRSVLIAPAGSRCEQRAEELGFEHAPVGMANDLDLGAILTLARTLKRLGVDLVHLHTGRATWLGSLAARMAGIPALTTRRQDKPVRTGPRTALIYRKLLRRAVAISDAVADHLRAGGVPAERVRVVPSAVDPAALAPAAPREHTRASLGAAADDVVALFLGALVPRKGVDVLLDALVHARISAPRLQLWVAGDGAERAALEARTAELPLAGHLRFLGRREDKGDLLAACDFSVLPSRAEGLGVAALEAMAAERAVIASRVGGLAKAVAPGETGLLVEADDAEELADALQRLANDDELRDRLGAAGPARVAEHHSPDAMVASYEALYAEVLAEERAP